MVIACSWICMLIFGNLVCQGVGPDLEMFPNNNSYVHKAFPPYRIDTGALYGQRGNIYFIYCIN